MKRLPTLTVYVIAVALLCWVASCGSIKRAAVPTAVGTGAGAIVFIVFPGFAWIAVPAAALFAHITSDLGAAEETRKDIARIADSKDSSVPWYLDGWAILKALCGWTALVCIFMWLAKRWEWFRPVVTGMTLGLGKPIAALLRRRLPFKPRGPGTVTEHP